MATKAKAEETELRVARVRGDASDRHYGILMKAAKVDCSPRSAIKAKCIECCGAEDYTRRIKECSTYSCPLNGFRPYQDTESEDETE